MKPHHYKIARWTIIVTILLMIIITINETIQAANRKQFNQVINERILNLEVIAVKNGELSINSSSAKRINSYMDLTNSSVTLYTISGNVAYSTGHAPDHDVTKHVPYYKKAGSKYITIQKLTDHNKQIGYIELISPYPDVKGLIIFYGLLFVIGIILVSFYDRTVRRYTRIISDAERLAERLSEGKYDARASEAYNDPGSSRLTYSLNILGRHLEHMSKSYLSQQGRLETLIENIGSGLIFIDGNGHISLVNKTYRQTFQTNTDGWVDREYKKVNMDEEVKNMIEAVFTDGAPLTRQIKLPVHIVRKHFDVSCVPILDHRQRIRGIVLVFHDITELIKLEKMRKDFVANVSHELKTPVTSVIGFTETLLDGAMEDEELAAKFLTIMLNESKRLQTLISELLELSKIEQEHFVLDFQPVKMGQLLNETLMVLEDKARLKKITLVNDTKFESEALGETGRIRQIMMNLVTNAISYTPQGGTINVSIETKGENVLFTVKDTGIGMEMDQIPRIFERFYRVDKARSRNQGGTGLGLAIVKHLVEAHEGHINVISVPGQGTTFEITFKKPQQKDGELLE